MKSPLKTTVYALIALNLLVLASVIGRPLLTGGRTSHPVRIGGKDFDRAVKWTAYVGLNDKDAGRPLFSMDEAKGLLNAVASRHVGGFTVSRAEGFWTNAEGAQDHEDTLLYCFLDATETQIVAIIEEMKKTLNQESILLEKSAVSRVFY